MRLDVSARRSARPASATWSRRGSTLVAVTTAAAIACGPPAAPSPPALPAGVAQMRLPADADTLRRLRDEDDAAGRLDRRRDLVAGLNRQLLLTPPEDRFVPELFDFLVALAPHVESGAVSTAWSSYLFTTYQRDVTRDRPDARPRRSSADVDAVLGEMLQHYALREARPGAGTPAVSPETAGFEAMRAWRDANRRAR